MRRAPSFGRARAAALYVANAPPTDPLKSTLQHYKYDRDPTLAPVLGDLLFRRIPFDVRGYDRLVSVPLHLDRLRWRGFNQAHLLARQVALRGGPAADAFALRRVRPTRPQVELTGADRDHNVSDAFAVPRPARVRGLRILLVDDVYTTGATANECSRALLDAGALAVDVLVLARAVTN